MIKIGLTGGICSGKSTVGKILQDNYGILVLDGDKLGHRVYEEDQCVVNAVIEAFGKRIQAGENGGINRVALGSIVFGDPLALAKLSSIVWPAIGKLAGEEMNKAWKQGHKVVVLEAAVLIEAGWTSMVDQVWVSDFFFLSWQSFGPVKHARPHIELIFLFFFLFDTQSRNA